MSVDKIIYEYTSTDRLISPHKYMYTKYLGSDFLECYINDRLEFLKYFSSLNSSNKACKIDVALCNLANEFINNKSESLNLTLENIDSLKSVTEIDTYKLIKYLIHNLVSKTNNHHHKEWIDFLLQRFEVTKKIYEGYHKDKLRVGLGKNNLVNLYWVFSVLLVLIYYQTANLKYLSTILKVNDLICSLDESHLALVPKNGMDLVLLNEIDFVKQISGKLKEVNFDFK